VTCNWLDERRQMTTVHSLHLVGLPPLMERTSGAADVRIGLIDGPVATQHPDLADARLKLVGGQSAGACEQTHSVACMHGTFVAGILCARRGSTAPAIAPGCTLLVRPIFSESRPGELPSATPAELAAAIADCVDAGARVINLSAALVRPASREDRLTRAIDHAAARGVIIVAAAGNQGTVGGTSSITQHPWVIPVAACSLQGRPLDASNMGRSIGRCGLSAPGEGVGSLTPGGEAAAPAGGTSVAAPFVSGAIALLCSEFPDATAAATKLAVLSPSAARRPSVVPPLLNAWAAHQVLQSIHSRRVVA
jgi:subtilisin family serine protease